MTLCLFYYEKFDDKSGVTNTCWFSFIDETACKKPHTEWLCHWDDSHEPGCWGNTWKGLRKSVCQAKWHIYRLLHAIFDGQNNVEEEDDLLLTPCECIKRFATCIGELGLLQVLGGHLSKERCSGTYKHLIANRWINQGGSRVSKYEWMACGGMA